MSRPFEWKSEQTKLSCWGTTNPNNDLIEETTRSVLKVTVWVVIGRFEVIGSHFFEDANGKTVKVNQVYY